MTKALDDMEFTEEYKSGQIYAQTSQIELTAQYNVHPERNPAGVYHMASQAYIKPGSVSVMHVSYSSLRKSLTESYLEPVSRSSSANVTTTINLNTFNQQKRIHRLLGSVLSRDYRFVHSRYMKAFSCYPPDISFAVVRRFEKRGLVLLQYEIDGMEREKAEVNRISAFLERALYDFNNFVYEKDSEANTATLSTVQQIPAVQKLVLNFSQHIPIFGSFKPELGLKRCLFTLSVGPIGFLQVEANASFRQMRCQVFQAKISVGEQFYLVKHLILSAVPAVYRLGFSDARIAEAATDNTITSSEKSDSTLRFAGSRTMHVLLPFSNSPEEQFYFNNEPLGDFLFLDFYSLLIEISKTLGELLILLTGLQACPRIVTYLGYNQIYVCNSTTNVVIRRALPLEAVCENERVVGADAILALFK